MEFLSSGFFQGKNPTHPSQPLMRTVKGSLTISFHQPKALPAPRAHVNFHLAVRLPHLAPPVMEPRPIVHRCRRLRAGCAAHPAAPPAPGPRVRLPPARYFTRARGWSGSGSGRGESWVSIAASHPGPGRREMEVASLPPPSDCCDGAKSAPPHSPSKNNLGRKMCFEHWGVGGAKKK